MKRKHLCVRFAAGMIALLVPFANLLLGPALVAGGTLLVLSLEPLGSSEATEIPPPPEQISRPAVPVVAATELEEDITIAPTTFEENLVENLPPPPSDASRIGDQPVFTPYTVRPEIKDRREAQRIVERYYPKLLKDAGIGGKVNIWVFIDTNGVVKNAQVQQGSGNSALDDAALKAAREFEFTPALNRDKKVPVWVAIPITFSVKR